MLEIEKPKIECVETAEDDSYGKFIIEPLERGYGITLGNALRRILLSSLPGVATSAVKIDTVLHEFSTVKGVKEDVTELILNIKSLALKMNGEGPRTVYIDAKGPGVVTLKLMEI
jgi:DNA-directed RNA polymerase subunit alpha